jgi:hypothetical protein
MTPTRRFIFVCAAAATMLVAAAGRSLASDVWLDDADVVVRHAWHRGNFERLAMKFPVGSLEVVGTPGDSIVLVLEPHHPNGDDEDWDRVTRRIHVREKKRGKTLELSVKGRRWFDTARVQLVARLEVPRAIGLDLNMNVGELDVTGIASDSHLELGVGEATVHSTERAFRRASVRVGIGEATLMRNGQTRERAGILGNALDWERGTGAAVLGLRVGIGEAAVYLD